VSPIPVARTVDVLAAHLTAHRDPVRAAGRTVGFVPTMGALHAGHAALVDAAAAACDAVVLSVFVNPLQFAPGEDLDAYPRTLDADLELAAAHGATVAFVPTVDAMYPEGYDRVVAGDVDRVDPGPAALPLEGEGRPTHFAGVAEVVARLLRAVGPCHAFFGEKDFQQLQVVRHLVAVLDLPVVVVGCPTVRDADGLALSSRNAYLNADERAAAPVLHRTLRAGAEAVGRPGWDRATVEAGMAAAIAAEPTAGLEYAVVVDPASLLPPEAPGPGDELRLLVACRFGRARLIDNVPAVAG
jgi:pantoate--beta-alanine ligase